MVPNQNTQTVARILGGLIVVVIALFILQTVQLIGILGSTSSLDINTTSDTAAITISQENSNAVMAGTGSAKLKLKPGKYLLVATDSTKHAEAVVDISKDTDKSINLALSDTPSVPSADNLVVSGQEALNVNGLTSTQVTNFRQLLFAFDKSAKVAVINVPTVAPSYHDPNSNDINFGISFQISLDGKTYNAQINYNDLTNIELILVDQKSNQQVLDVFSAPTPSASSPTDSSIVD